MLTPEEIFAGIENDNNLYDISILVATAGKPSQSFSQRLNESELNQILGSMIRWAQKSINMDYTLPSDSKTIHWMFTKDENHQFTDIHINAELVS